MKKVFKNYPAQAIILIIFFGTMLSFTGCQPVYPGSSTPVPDPEEVPGVTLEPGDVISIKFFSVSELDDTQTVRPDGKITLQFINDFEVAGKTPKEVRDELVGLYSKIIEKPDLTVIIRSLYDRVVYVTGEVNTPGTVDMPGRMTALEAIMKAGGFNAEFARMNKVVVIRDEDGKRNRYVLNLKGVLTGVKVHKPFYLKPHDILYVPRY